MALPHRTATQRGSDKVSKVPCLVKGKDRNWGLRRRVPDDLRPVIGKTEVWVFYGAVSYAKAKAMHPSEMAKVEQRFA